MFLVGHRVIVQTQPELGLGLVVSVEGRNVEVLFSGSGVVRRYVAQSSPLKRMVLAPGQKATMKDGQTFTVTQIKEEEGLCLYRGDGGEQAWEYELHHHIQDMGALNQFLMGQWSSHKSYPLRRAGWNYRRKAMDPEVRGLVGSRVSLLPHQLYVASEVSGRELPRVLLADEVGLGKTIEAGLIYSSLRAQGRASKVLILVPEHLKHQWLAEMYRRFNEMFTLIDEDRSLEEEESQDASPFEMNERIICSMDFLLANLDRLEQAQEEEWDLVIVDEAHHLSWYPDDPSLKWKAAQALSAQTEGLLLITATPRLQGIETQFGLLNLVDSERFSSFKEFQEQTKEMKKVAEIAREISLGEVKEESLKYLKSKFSGSELDEALAELKESNRSDKLLHNLVDRHGTGRVLIRNRRERLQGFPKRKLCDEPISLDDTANKHLHSVKPSELSEEALMELACGRSQISKLDGTESGRGKWLNDFLARLGDEKALLICSTPQRVKEIESWFDKHSGIRKGIFHEGLEIVERDRQAAWFAQPTGAQVLIASEIGGEGRNFQFAHKLVLFDLPAHPDLLEQRIGRLDRIGQTETIEIYVPYLAGSPEEVLFKWYHDGLGSFEGAWTGGALLADSLENELLETTRDFLPRSDGFEKRQARLKKLISDTRADVKKLRKQQQESVDTLVDINSFDETKGNQLANRISRVDSDDALANYMELIFNYFGVQHEDLDTTGTIKLRASALTFVDNFPELPPETDKLITYRRDQALAREELTFLSQDHPMVQGALGLLLDRDEGRASVCLWPNSPRHAKLIVQLFFLLEVTAPSYLGVEQDLPLTSFEFVVDEEGTELSPQEHRLESATLKSIPEASAGKPFPGVENFIRPIVERCNAKAESESKKIVNKALKTAEKRLDEEHDRLLYLKKVNSIISDEEVELHLQKKQASLKAIRIATPRLDAIRMILLK